MGEPMLGQIMMFGGSYAPRNWTFCAGQLAQISDNTALFSVMGSVYGGDGRVTFGIPDLRGKSPLGMGDAPGLTPRILGYRGGAEGVHLTASQMPQHSHPISAAEISGNIACTAHAANTEGDEDTPNNAFVGKPTNDVQMYTQSDGDLQALNAQCISTSHTLTVSGDTSEAGGGNAHENMHPWICMNYILAVEGYYPARS